MAELFREGDFEPQIPAAHKAASDAAMTPRLRQWQVAYVKFIDAARKADAVAMAIFGIGYGICANRTDYLTETLRQEPGIWLWGRLVFGIGVLGCLIATLLLVVEGLARPVAPKPFTLRALLVRSLLIILGSTTVGVLMLTLFGVSHAIGAVTGVLLVLAAWREHRVGSYVLAVLARSSSV